MSSHTQPSEKDGQYQPGHSVKLLEAASGYKVDKDGVSHEGNIILQKDTIVTVEKDGVKMFPKKPRTSVSPTATVADFEYWYRVGTYLAQTYTRDEVDSVDKRVFRLYHADLAPKVGGSPSEAVYEHPKTLYYINSKPFEYRVQGSKEVKYLKKGQKVNLVSSAVTKSGHAAKLISVKNAYYNFEIPVRREYRYYWRSSEYINTLQLGPSGLRRGN